MRRLRVFACALFGAAAVFAAVCAGKPAISEYGSYDSKEEVALYIWRYGHLPCNYITKAQAQRLGWRGGSLEPYAPGKSIGGDRFGNYENRLPPASYKECDIDTRGRPRGAKRLVYSNALRIFYTEDHYRTFVEIKPERLKWEKPPSDASR